MFAIGPTESFSPLNSELAWLFLALRPASQESERLAPSRSSLLLVGHAHKPPFNPFGRSVGRPAGLFAQAKVRTNWLAGH